MNKFHSFITKFIANQTGLDISSIQIDLPFDHYGLTSSQLIALVQSLETEYNRSLRLTLGWEYPSIEELSRFLSNEISTQFSNSSQSMQDDIAIVGMSCRFPMAKNLKAFWDLCWEGVDAITQVPAERWDLASLYDPDPSAKGKIYSRWGGFLDHLDQFDASFFGISPREAFHLDPRQRLMLETSWEALQDAGIEPHCLKGSNTGVFLATLSDDYGKLVFSNSERIEAYSGSGTAHSMVANRLSYFYDFHGPSLAIDTACSGSLVALHLANHSLKARECSIALVGGVNVLLTPDSSIFFSRAQALSKDGRCKTFDANADGFVRSEGAGIVVLKRLSDAISSKDRIYAIIKGSAINQDGRTNGTMAPNPKAQEAVLREAYRQARISPSQVQYIELHGTGTKIGDPIEAQALTAVLKEERSPLSKCFVGSVKTNIGHTEAAAGIAGVIKTSLAVYHKKLPKSLHFQNLNPLIPQESSPFEVITASGAWPDLSQELIAGVSAFGFGGTNGHVVLSSTPASAQAPPLSLPTTTWNKKHFWIETQKNIASNLLSSYINPIKTPLLHVWNVDIPKSALFSDHKVGTDVVFPGSGYLEMVLEAAQKRGISTPIQLQNIRFLHKLKLPQTDSIQLSLTDEPAEIQFEVHTSQMSFATGSIISSVQIPPDKNPEKILAACPNVLSAKNHYRTMSMQGLHYGVAFQALQDIHLGISEAIAKIECPSTHPWTICIDALFQMASSLGKAGEGHERRLPIGVKKFECFALPSSSWVYGYAYLEGQDASLHIHLELLDQTGRLLARITSLQLLTVFDSPTPSVLALNWEKSSNPSPSSVDEKHNPWLIFGKKEKLSNALKKILTRKGDHVVQIEKSCDFISFKENLSSRKWNVIALMPEPFAEALALTQICIEASIAPTLCFVTRGTQAIGDEPISLTYQSLIWGLARAAAHIEHPALKGKLIDLDLAEASSSVEAQRILEMWLDSEDQIAWRQNVRYQIRLKKAPLPIVPPISFRAGAAYLITGGLGELGLSVAQWMAHRGAHHLILTGVNEIPSKEMWKSISAEHPRFQAIQKILTLESQGCQIESLTLDTTNLASLTNLLQQRKEKGLPSIQGIIHAAGAVKDAPIPLVTEEHIQAILPPKVDGAINLCTAFKDEPLDFLLFFSSLAATLPIIGQSVYAAANAFLDAFVHFLRGQNLPAFSIDWGPVQLGMAAALENKNLHAKRGMFPMEPYLCWDIMGQILQSNLPSVVVTAADWSQVHRSRAYSPPMIRELGSMPASHSKNNSLVSKPVLSLLEQLKEYAASVLQIAKEEIVMTHSLAQMGLDSLMATELKNLLAVKIGIQVAMSQLLQEMSLEHLAQSLELVATPQETRTRLPLSHHKIPLSYAQEGIWFLEKSENQFSFNIAGIATHLGAFDPTLFYRAVDEVIVSQEILRTAFSAEEGVPYATVLPPAPINRNFLDLSHLSKEEKEQIFHQTCEQEARRSFDLETGRLLRILCVKIKEQEYRVLVVMHHLICDGVSTRILMQNVFSILRSQTLSPPTFQYADYAIDQRQKSYADDLQFWERTLQIVPPVLELPRSATKMPSFAGRRVAFTIPEHLVIRVKDLAKQEQTTPFMIFFAVYSILLERYSGQESFAIGVITAGRQTKETEDLIGCFINTLPIVIDLFKEITFRDYLTRIKATLLAAYDHSNVSFEQILRHIHAPRDPLISPLFQAAFSFEKDPTSDLKDESFSFQELHLRTSRYELSLEMTLGKQNLHAWFDYKADALDHSMIERMASHFVILLENALDHMDTAVQQLDLLSREEKTTMLTEWNQTTSSYPKDLSIYEIFLKQVNLTPQSIALEDERRSISYHELGKYIHLLSQKFESLGIQKGFTVGLYADRSIEFIVAILSLLKLGACYVPIDPAHPLDRIRHIADSANLSLIVTKDLPLEVIQKLAVSLYTLEPIANMAQEGASLLEYASSAQATDAACILYTSGSTGTPKGVVISHRNISRLVCNTNYAHFGPNETFLLFAPLNFDAALFEIWGPLLNGGRLVIAPARLLGFDELGLLIEKHKVSTLWMTAALFQSMDTEAMRRLSSLCQFLVGGDVVSEAQSAQFIRMHPNCRLINGYGPTEGTTFSCYHPICLEDLQTSSIPIGKPIANAQVYVLDRHLNPVPIGVPGEIYIGGDGLALEYVQDPKLTKERFISTPFHPRLYKTGDRGWFLLDGTIRFGGRLDSQVKLRGFRIELEEIEIHLRAHPNIKEAVVVLHKNLRGGDQLCAYITLNQPLNANTYKEFLKDRLPSYMIPSFFVTLSKMPLSARGKIARNMLPQPELSSESEPVQIPSEEKTLQEIWTQLLHVEAVRRTDNFFELGGDSIRALQMVSLAKRKGLSFTVQDVFTEQTLERIAAKNSTPAVRSPRAFTQDTIPLTPIQQWFFQQSIPNPAHWNHWVLFTLPTPLAESSLYELAERHDCFWLRFRKKGDRWEQFTAQEKPFEISRLSLFSTHREVKKQALSQAINEEHRRLDLENGPLFRFTFIEGLEENRHHLLIIAHHLVMDQMSWHILLNEIEILCETKEALSSAPSSHSFTEWSLHLQELKKSPTIQNELIFWDSIPWHTTKPIPCDHSDGSNLEKDSVTVESICDIGSTNHQRLDDFLTMVLIQTLQEWNDQQPVCIALEQQGRPSSLDVYHTIGWFTQIYPIFAEPGVSLDFLQEQLRQFSHHALSFSLLRQEKFKNATQILFNFLGVMDDDVRSATQFGMDANPPICNRDPNAERTHWIEINALVTNRKLHVYWTFSPNLHNHETIAHLSGRFQIYLHRNLHERSLSPADFPLAALQKTDLEQLQKNCKRIDDVYILTPLQEGLLLHSLLNPTSDKYLVQCVLQIESNLNLDRLQQSFRLILERYPILRTSFHTQGLKHPVQVIEPSPDVPWAQIETEDFDAAVQKDRLKPFDLSFPPLMRFYIAKLGNTTRILWTYHHILMDGWSLSIVLRDWFMIYEQLSLGNQILLPTAISFKQFVKALTSLPPVKAWQTFLAGHRKPTPLPDLTLSEANGCFSHDLRLTPEMHQALMSRLSQERLTIATFMQGIWALVLSHFSGEKDIVFGITVSGRNLDLPEIESIVGLCINTVPQRIKIDRLHPLSSWFKHIQDLQIRMQPYHHVPLASIQGKQPLFQSVVVIENYPIEDKKGDDKAIKLVSIETKEKVEYPLTLMVFPSQQLLVRLLFDESKFSLKGAQQILDTISSLISVILNNWDSNVGTHLPLSRQELERGLQEIWAELLGTPNVGLQDAFQDLGGNSLTLMRMKGLMQQRFDIDFPLVDLFKYQTIKAIVEAILSELHLALPVQQEAEINR